MDKESSQSFLLLAIALILVAVCIGYSIWSAPPISDPAVVTTTDTPSATVSAAFNGRIHINSAPQSQLETLDGIGPSLAKRIVDYRDAHGGFTSTEELLEVKGIGEKLYQKILPYIDL